MTRKFALGGDVGDFKAVVCFIQPGTLRIADVHRCDPVAVFYTDTFNIPERQYTEGLPGVTGRSSWFIVDYRGSFTVSQDGDYPYATIRSVLIKGSSCSAGGTARGGRTPP